MPIDNISEFYERNVGLVHQVTNKCYARVLSVGGALDYDDLFQEASEVFLRVCQHFDESRGKFSTYFTRSAFNKMNSLIRDIEMERCELGISSVEEIDEHSEIIREIVSLAPTPDEVISAKENAAHVISKLSPLTELICEWFVRPPEFLVTELAKNRAHCEYARSKGFNRRSDTELSINFLCELLMRLTGVSVKEMRIIRAELKWVIEQGENNV